MGLVGKAFGVVSQPVKDAMAANRIYDLKEKRDDLMDAKAGITHGTLYNMADDTLDNVYKAVNLATLGVVDRVRNIGRKGDDKIDYKRLSDAKKADKIKSNSSVNDRARALRSRSVSLIDFGIEDGSSGDQFDF